MALKAVLSLQVMKSLELLVPLMAIPFVIRAFGLETFGFLALVQAASQYLIVVGDWGFNANATKEFAAKKVKYYKWIVLYRDIQRIKLVYLAFLFLIIFPFFFIYDEYAFVLLFFYLWIFFSILQLRWFFQARNLLVRLMLVTIIFRFAYLAYVLFFLNRNSDLGVYVLFFVLPIAAASIYSNAYFIMNAHSSFPIPWKNKGEIAFGGSSVSFIEMLKEGWHLTSSRFFSSLLNPLFLLLAKLAYGLDFVGFVSVVQRIVSALVSVFLPIVEVLFPVIVQRVTISVISCKILVTRILAVIVGLSLAVSGALYVFRDVVFRFFDVSTENGYETTYLLISSLLVLFSVSNSLFSHSIVAMHRTHLIFRCTVIGMFCGLSCLFLLDIADVGEIRFAISMVSTQLVMFIFLAASFYWRYA